MGGGGESRREQSLAIFTSRATLPTRLAHNHLSLLALSIIAGILADLLLCKPSPLVFRASMATGYVALLWLVVALAIGPLRVLGRKPLSANSYLRRDIGVWAAVSSVGHVIASLCISTTGMVELHAYFFRRTADGLVLRTDEVGWANHTGAVATLLVLLLLVTSSDAAIRRLGARAWKNLQRSIYAAALLVVAHCVLYQDMIERRAATLAVFWVLTGGLVLLQLGGLIARRRRA